MDADIKGAFDNIDHTRLLETIGDAPGRELIKQWLKAGYVDKGVFAETKTGTPQGGVISPLLANIALHGMEEALGVTYAKKKDREPVIRGARAVVRYADDFVVFCESRADAETVIDILTVWLKERGLTLSPEKTRIVHLSEGFDFLGYTVRHHKVTNTRTGWKLLITPSKKAVQEIRDRLRAEWQALRGHNVAEVCTRLNRIVRGWANYHRVNVASRVFHSLDQWMFKKIRRWITRTHPHKSRAWTRQRYWGYLNPRQPARLVFGDTRTGLFLLRFDWFTIKRHTLVQGTYSPDDPRLRAYWLKRNAAKAKDQTAWKRSVAHAQEYVCLTCGESLYNGEELQKHHVAPRSAGGTDTYGNIRLAHLYCHQTITSEQAARKAVFT